MTGFNAHFMSHLRLAILRTLNDAPESSLNAPILTSIARDAHGLPATRDQVQTAIGWLSDQGLVRRETVGHGETSIIVAHLLEPGRDVAEGRSRVDGVARLNLAG